MAGTAANQSRGGPETGDPQGTKQSAGLLAALVANDNDLGGGLTHGVGHIRLHHEVLTNERCKNQAQHRAANGHQHDLENAELRIIVQDENAGNGKRQTARHHGTGGHTGMGHVNLIDIGVAMAFRANMDASATNMMGQGRDDAFRATNMEEHVKMMEPTTPIIIARAVNCSLKELACLT